MPPHLRRQAPQASTQRARPATGSESGNKGAVFNARLLVCLGFGEWGKEGVWGQEEGLKPGMGEIWAKQG